MSPVFPFSFPGCSFHFLSILLSSQHYRMLEKSVFSFTSQPLPINLPSSFHMDRKDTGKVLVLEWEQQLRGVPSDGICSHEAFWFAFWEMFKLCSGLFFQALCGFLLRSVFAFSFVWGFGWVLAQKEWIQKRNHLEMANLPPSLPPSLSQQIPAGDAVRCSDMNNTQILGCSRSFFFSSHQFAYSK